MSLNDNCYQLTNPHLTMRHGKAWVMPGYLDLLQRAITGSTHNGATSGREVSLPISAGALALQQDIDREARQLHAKVFGNGNYGTTRDKVRIWGQYSVAADYRDLEDATGRWIRQIDGLVNTVQPQRRLTLNCPACNTLYHEGKAALQVNCYNPDGTLKHIGTWTAECLACEAMWDQDAMTWLIRSLKASSGEGA